MTVSIEQHPGQSRLRRWWRATRDFLEAMDTSGYHEHAADRFNSLEERIQRLETLHSTARNEQAPARQSDVDCR